MGRIIVVTGASSGLGALAVRALARAGHTVYAGMRETTGRNAPAVAELGAFGRQHRAGRGVHAGAVRGPLRHQRPGHATGQPRRAPHLRGQRSRHVDPSNDGAEVVNAVADRIRGEFLRRVELTDLI